MLEVLGGGAGAAAGSARLLKEANRLSKGIRQRRWGRAGNRPGPQARPETW